MCPGWPFVQVSAKAWLPDGLASVLAILAALAALLSPMAFSIKAGPFNSVLQYNQGTERLPMPAAISTKPQSKPPPDYTSFLAALALANTASIWSTSKPSLA